MSKKERFRELSLHSGDMYCCGDISIFDIFFITVIYLPVMLPEKNSDDHIMCITIFVST